MRRKPYTAAGIRRVPCVKCGAPSYASWQICADGRQHRGLCKEHDIELNRMVATWAFGAVKAKPMLSAYAKKLA